MSENWQKVFTSSNIQQVEILKGLLHEKDIESVIINKQDSLYTMIGEIQLFVSRDDVLQAIKIINKATE